MYPIGFLILTSSYYRLSSMTKGDVLTKIALLKECEAKPYCEKDIFISVFVK